MVNKENKSKIYHESYPIEITDMNEKQIKKSVEQYKKLMDSNNVRDMIKKRDF